MRQFVFITGNQHKADYLAKWLGLPIEHQAVDLDELQSLSLRIVVEHKARQAYELVRRPVLVEDVGFTFLAMGRLPGPFIKWFLEELGDEGICRLVGGLAHRRALAAIMYAWYDGREMHIFESKMAGEVPASPRGSFGFGWNSLFVPEGSDKTYAEMSDDEVRSFSMRAQAIDKLKAFLLHDA